MARTTGMTSKERILAALRRQPVDYVPCSPIFNPQDPGIRVRRPYEFPFGTSFLESVAYGVESLGLDMVVHFKPYADTAPAIYFPAPEASARVWMEGDTIHKAWTTPAGVLRAAVKHDNDWPFGLDIPLFHNHLGHCLKPWLETEADLECLRYILRPPETSEHLDVLRLMAKEAKTEAQRYQLPILTHLGSGLTGAQQLIGGEQICLMIVDKPDLVDAYLELEHRYTLRRIEIAIDLGVDIIQRDGFYETCDFYSPAMLERFLGKRLRKETATAHQGGKAIVYTLNTGIMPMLDYLATLDFDCIYGIDMTFRDTDIRRIKAKLGNRQSFWMGPASQLHLYARTEEPVRQAVRECFAVFGKVGFILAPSVSAHSMMPWANTLAMIDEWKKLR